MNRKSLPMLGLLVAVTASFAVAQAPPPQLPPPPQAPNLPRPTPESGKKLTDAEKQERAEELQERAKELFFKVFRMPKEDCQVVGDRRVRAVNVFGGRMFELIGEEGDYYLLRNLPPEDPDSPGHRAWVRGNVAQLYEQDRAKYYADKWDITDLDDIYPPFTDKLEFVRRDDGLPRGGRWQMSFDVADMNGDGRPDLVMPPMRLGYPFPSIMLQQKDGSWKPWEGLLFPKDVKFDYGTVRVADFDGDGHPDIAVACHFGRSYVLYGNGKGDFQRYTVLPQANGSVTARALTVADFDKDGRPDIALLAEVSVAIGSSELIHDGLVSVELNRPTGWQVVSKGFPNSIQGDWLTAADVDLDGWPDLLLTSRMLGIRDLVWRNIGKGEAFEAIANLQMPVSSYVFANAVGHFDDFASPDVVYCFEQFNWKLVEPPSQACAVFHFHDAAGKPSLVPTAKLFLKTEKAYDNNLGVAVGDIDGDGRDDIAVISAFGSLRIFLQFPDHSLYEERSPEVSLGNAAPFGVRIADLDGDGRGEVIVCAAPGTGEKPEDGGVWVFSPHPKPAGAHP
jgi:hypothetical protein